jgi:hypothetical protein
MSDENQTRSSREDDQKTFAKKAKPINQHEKLRKDLLDFTRNRINIDWNEKWDDDFPKKWKIGKPIFLHSM